MCIFKVEFLPKFSVKGVWKRWIESYPLNSSKDANAVTVFTGVGKINTLKTKMGFARYFLIFLISKRWIKFFIISTYLMRSIPNKQYTTCDNVEHVLKLKMS